MKKSFPYGTVLKIQRESSLKDIFDRLDKIRALGMDTVVIWPSIFWWEDRTLPHYPYNTGREILKYAEKIGLKIIMELSGQLTSLEYAPDSVMKEEYYATTAEGHTDNQSWHYGYLNYNHPEVKMLIRKAFTEAASNYKDYSSLYGYDIWNETMFSSQDRYTLQLFREWLKNRYGSIERLNQVWDRAYYDWSQVTFTKWMWASVMPVVDYNRFKKENIGVLLKEWRSIVKEIDPDHPVIADNIHSMITDDASYNTPHDDWNAAENVDEYGISFYPKNVPPYMTPDLRCEVFTAIHSATKTGRFWVSEMQSHCQSMFTPNSVVYPHELRWWNWEAISRGAKGIVYWKWDPFIKGLQTFGRGLVDLRGHYTERSCEAESIKRIIDSHKEEFCGYMPAKPKAAILYDRMNHDFVRAYTVNYRGYISESIYTDSINGLFKCLWELDIPVKFITAEDFIQGRAGDYTAVFATSQICMTEGLSSAILGYVRNGGAFISDGRFGLINEDGVLYGNTPGGGLHAEMGWELADVDVRQMDFSFYDVYGNGRLKGYYEKQLIEITGGKAEIQGKFEDGRPAVIVSRAGGGHFMHIATNLWYGYFKERNESTKSFMRTLADKLGLFRLRSDSDNVRVALLEGEGGMLLFAFNYSGTEQSAAVELIGTGPEKYGVTNLYSNHTCVIGRDVSGLSIPVKLDGFDTCVYKLEPVEN